MFVCMDVSIYVCIYVYVYMNVYMFSWEKWSKFAKFQKEKIFKSPDFYNKFQSVGKNIEGSWYFSTFIFGM